MRATTFLPFLVAISAFGFAAEDWTDWRGPLRDGRSSETGLPSSWSPDGDNLAWRAPYGGRSTPVIFGDHLYLQNGAGEGAELQERILCLDVDTGELLWERRINLYLSDVPPHRVGWASPVVDTETGSVFVFTVGGTLAGFLADGQPLWERSLVEDFGLITTHGGRTASPIIDGELVIVSGLSSGWGEQARGGQRFFAFHKATGETYWVSSPGGQPYDTTYAPSYITEVEGVRVLITGGGDGAMHALKPQTGEPVWRFEYSKRGINTGVVVKDGVAIVSQGEENLNTSEMGLVAAIDATSHGEIPIDKTKWAVEGFLGGFSSPVLDGDRFYLVDNSANLAAFDFSSGRELWQLKLGTIQRASPVLADGKLYVGTVNGTFFIIQPGPERGELIDRDELPSGSEFEEIYASVAVSDGRVYLASASALYAIGPKERKESPSPAPPQVSTTPGELTFVQVAPTELVLGPGESVEVKARLFDAAGRLVREAEPEWSLDGLEGIVEDGRFTASSDSSFRAGKIKATVGALSGAARVRVVPPLPWSQDFESLGGIPPAWINATGKFEIRDEEGGKILAKKSDNPFLRRARVYMGPSSWSNYTVEADVKAHKERRQMGNVGVIAQRYQLTLLGNHQRLELQSWQPETERTAKMPFPWEGDTWYRMKLEVTTSPGGRVVARGKVWPRGEPEPAEWQLIREDEKPNVEGSPGIFAEAQPYEVFLDNLQVRANP
ncbi:MAG TPA: PQQ-binding-like beta-propeller repeat protein [Vicinamibacteria bacterium]|nr:PQQ-binding-like beta-propeller repeat protein [Vicinamibacteria bacterium]